MKIISEAVFDFFQCEIAYLRGRIGDLEKQNAGLIDRLLIEKGQMPLDENLGTELKAQARTQEDLFEQLTQDEIGEYTPDVESSATAETS